MSFAKLSKNLAQQEKVVDTIVRLIDRCKSNITRDTRLAGEDSGLFAFRMTDDVAEGVTAWAVAFDIKVAKIEDGNYFVSF